MPEQDRAIDIVWNQTYHASSYSPPLFIKWRTDLGSCVDSGVPSWLNGNMCVGGLEYNSTYIEVAWTGKYSTSGFAHELMHVFQSHRGIDDPAHSLPEWSLVKDANLLLTNNGL